jgi:hypothetical protein
MLTKHMCAKIKRPTWRMLTFTYADVYASWRMLTYAEVTKIKRPTSATSFKTYKRRAEDV